MYLTFLVSRLSHIYNRAELDLQLLALLDRPLVATWPGPRALGLKGVSSLHSHSPPPHPPPRIFVPGRGSSCGGGDWCVGGYRKE